MGIPRNRDYNGTMQAGVSYVQRIIQNGRRKSAARGYLHPAMKRKNLTVRTHAHATEIVLEGKRAVGVRYRKGGRNGAPMEVRAAKEVILSGGTVNSPQLLQVSGIGPAPLLQSLGIAVKHDLPGVGENLRDHYAPRFVARVKNAETINEKSHGLKLVSEVLKYAFTRKGILALNPTLIYVFWKSDERVDNYDLQLTFTPASYKEGVQSTLDDFPGMTIASWQQRPDSIGYIRARSADPFEHPVIQPNYLVAESDRQVLLAGMKLARRLLALAGAQQILRPRGIPRPEGAVRRRAARRRQAARHHDLPSHGHLPHGAGQRPDRRGRRSAARARARGAARGRRLDHADHAVGQPQCLGADDRREGRRHDPRQAAARGGGVEGLNGRRRQRTRCRCRRPAGAGDAEGVACAGIRRPPSLAHIACRSSSRPWPAATTR